MSIRIVKRKQKAEADPTEHELLYGVPPDFYINFDFIKVERSSSRSYMHGALLIILGSAPAALNQQFVAEAWPFYIATVLNTLLLVFTGLVGLTGGYLKNLRLTVAYCCMTMFTLAFVIAFGAIFELVMICGEYALSPCITHVYVYSRIQFFGGLVIQCIVLPICFISGIEFAKLLRELKEVIPKDFLSQSQKQSTCNTEPKSTPTTPRRSVIIEVPPDTNEE